MKHGPSAWPWELDRQLWAHMSGRPRQSSGRLTLLAAYKTNHVSFGKLWAKQRTKGLNTGAAVGWYAFIMKSAYSDSSAKVQLPDAGIILHLGPNLPKEMGPA